ncbi:MAG: hypothetical protein ACR2RF_09910 [Geminicoccaceae bacterium]
MKPRDIAYLQQLDRRFSASVFDVVATGLWRRVGLLGAIRGELASKVTRRSPPSALSAEPRDRRTG